MIHVEEYDGFTRDGTSKYVHALHIGGKRFYIEFYASGLHIRFGSWAFSCGVEWADE